MNLDLHADVSSLPLWKRASYGLCLIAGIGGLFLFSFVLALEVQTSPRHRGPMVWIFLPIIFSLWHVAGEMRASGPLPLLRWAIFLIATGSLAWNAWTLIADPIGAAIFAAWGVASSGLIFLARLIARAAPPTGSMARRANS